VILDYRLYKYAILGEAYVKDDRKEPGIPNCITIKTLTGKSFVIEAQSGDLISKLKDRINDKESIPSK
jgi:hypothetical protein